MPQNLPKAERANKGKSTFLGGHPSAVLKLSCGTRKTRTKSILQLELIRAKAQDKQLG